MVGSLCCDMLYACMYMSCVCACVGARVCVRGCLGVCGGNLCYDKFGHNVQNPLKYHRY